jgi:FkbM family methyltransferase
LKRHLAMNRVANCDVVEAAVAEGVGSTGFTEGENASTGRVDASGHIRVPSVSLDAFVHEQGHPPPTVIKMDIEGGEVSALRGGRRVLQDARPILFLATHGPAVHGACLDILRTAGYSVESLDSPDVESSAELLAQP